MSEPTISLSPAGPLAVTAGDWDPVDLTAHPWRVGRRVGRTIYAQLGPEPSDRDTLIGVMDTPALAEAAMRAHNLLATLRAEVERLRYGAAFNAYDTILDLIDKGRG